MLQVLSTATCAVPATERSSVPMPESIHKNNNKKTPPLPSQKRGETPPFFESTPGLSVLLQPRRGTAVFLKGPLVNSGTQSHINEKRTKTIKTIARLFLQHAIMYKKYEGFIIIPHRGDKG